MTICIASEYDMERSTVHLQTPTSDKMRKKCALSSDSNKMMGKCLGVQALITIKTLIKEKFDCLYQSLNNVNLSSVSLCLVILSSCRWFVFLAVFIIVSDPLFILIFNRIPAVSASNAAHQIELKNYIIHLPKLLSRMQFQSFSHLAPPQSLFFPICRCYKEISRTKKRQAQSKSKLRNMQAWRRRIRSIS